jgi:hypothetical protein
MLAEGGIHIFVWGAMVLGLIGLVESHVRKRVFWTIICIVIVNAYRLIPAAYGFRAYAKPFRGGFPDFGVFVDALITVKACTMKYSIVHSGYDGLMWHEYDAYVGLGGLILILAGFGFWISALREQKADIPWGLCVAGGALGLFSFGDIYAVVYNLGFGMVSSERAPSRFFIVPLLLVIVFAAIGLSRYCSRIGRYGRVSALILLAVTIIGLWQHAKLWSLGEVENGTAHSTLNVFVTGASDSLYRNVVLYSWGISLLGCVAALGIYGASGLQRLWRRAKFTDYSEGLKKD